MDKFVIEGPQTLRGKVRASGAKNAALPNLAAMLLAQEPVTLDRVPHVQDIRTMRKLLEHMGVQSERQGDDSLQIDPNGESSPREAPYALVKTMRASVLSLGPLVARRGKAKVSLPGGCAIGVRPIDQHLAGLEALGADIRLDGGYVHATADRLKGARFRFSVPTVGGTENVLMAATLAKGTTVLENCAREPEIADLAKLLNTLGAKIEGAGTSTITIEGVDELGGGRHPVIADRIEGGTYLVGAAITGGDVTLEDCVPADLAPLTDKLAEAGATVEITDNSVRVHCCQGDIQPVDITTEPHPGFPTDLQAQYMALMTQAQGESRLDERVFENRFQHVPELGRMGARIHVESNAAIVQGPTPLTGSEVMATDLRASACLVLAALVAEGTTRIDRIYHLDRGYEKMEEKLHALGAHVERTRDSRKLPKPVSYAKTA